MKIEKKTRRDDMQIGEFAKICNTKITILRHYDKEGLLEADHVDPFTGYRYYSSEQIPIFFRITALKKAGFSLLEIKQILSSVQSNEEVLLLFEKKQKALFRMIADLDEARRIILGAGSDFEVKFTENDGVWQAESTAFNANYEKDAREMAENLIGAKRYQRISPYRMQSIPNSGYAYLSCDVLKLNMNALHTHDDFHIPFENDEAIIGKWEIVGEYAVEEDFYKGLPKGIRSVSEATGEIYFLPEGKRYWCYAWTKGKLLFYFDGETTVNPYRTEVYDGALHMFVEMKSYEYRYGGRPIVLVLRQLDRVRYCAENIRKHDDVDLPFISDKAVIGNWRVFDCCQVKERFDPSHPSQGAFVISAVCFEEEGKAALKYYTMNKTKKNERICRWTKNFLIMGGLACAYEIRLLKGREYLFLEWKNGDYVYGGKAPWYYIFVRDEKYEGT